MMQPKEVKSLIQQVLYCYGANRKATQPLQLVFSGVAEGTKTHEGLRKQSGYESWEVQKLPGNYIDTFPKEKLIYLTADAEEKVYNFDSEMIYVIGGIVTHTKNVLFVHCWPFFVVVDSSKKLDGLANGIIFKVWTPMSSDVLRFDRDW